MAQTLLVAHTGRTTGSSESRRLRREDKIPGVLYGQGMEPIVLHVERRDLRLALSGSAGANTVLDLQVNGTVYPAIVKDMQRHPIRRTVSHVDFLQVNLSEAITVSVPLRLEGEAKAVLAAGGMVDPAVDSIEVTTTPSNIPDELVVDVSNLQPGQTFRLADVSLPAGVTATGDPDMAVVSVLMSRTAGRPAGDEGDAAAEAAGDEAVEAEAATEAASGDDDTEAE
jgi:large subunit ribosomal protein L25